VCGVGKISTTVHYVTIGNIILGTRGSTLRGKGTTSRHVSVEHGEFRGSGKVEVQRHFII
jgi:hypothetical protein